MSTPPPRPGYAPVPPAPPDRRTQQAQRRATKEQARVAREQARLRMRALQRRSITGPVLLITLGISLLLLQSGRLHWDTVLIWLSLWWPAILIGTGTLLILEWLLDQRVSAHGGAPAPRRILGGAATTLLLLLAIAGAGLMFAHRSGSFLRDVISVPLFGHDRNNWTELLGVHSDFTSEQTAPLEPSGVLTIEDPHGDVIVTGSSDDGRVHVSVHQHLFTLEHDDLNLRHTREQVGFRGNSDNLTLTATPEGEDDADLTVQLPHNASLVIHSGKGDVSVEELHGATTIVAANGDVKLTALRGPVRVDTQDDDSTITAHSLGGGLMLNGHSGDMTLSDIDGGLTLHGDFFGTTQMERIRGNVSFQSSFTNFNCAGIPGSLVVEGRSDLTGTHLLGPLTLATTDRNLTLDGVRGAATVTDRNGSVALTLAAPLQAVHVSNTNGTVDISVPARQPFTLHAKAQDAEIHSDLDLSAANAGTTGLLNGQVLGGGPQLNIETSNDDIGIHSAAADNTFDWNATPGTAQASPGAGAPPKHNSHRQ